MALIVRAAGTNCDAELARAFSLAGATVTTIHVDALAADPRPLESADLIGFPGGFSYGDDVASGRIFALRLRRSLYGHLRAAVDRGACVIGVCNGFQVLVQAGLLPGGEGSRPTRDAALTDNDTGRFSDRWVGVRPDPESRCVWTRGLAEIDAPDAMMLPIANGEGRFIAAPATLDRLERDGLVALRYGEPVNGSDRDIAGICDATGRVFGLMPHPERYLDWSRHPFWTRLAPSARSGPTPGLRIFQNAVASVTAVAAG
jgi:phosphoribosylformylglycinamidine synthase